jgi:carbamoyl-phosphate synthase small subunit
VQSNTSNENKIIPAAIALEDGLYFKGESFGATGETLGEAVFNTSMTGYQEILTDPSYKGQSVIMTYCMIGNYGTNSEDVESRRPWVEGFVVREYIDYPSNWRSEKSLNDYLVENGIIGIQGVDTRALTRHLRDNGAKRCAISTEDLDKDSLVAKAKAFPSIVGQDMVRHVTTEEPYVMEPPRGSAKYKVVLYDFGVKLNIARELAAAGCEVRVVPASTPAAAVLELKPDGVLLSNGPGDPEPLDYAVKNIQQLIGKLPVFGICLGHQLLGLALGGKTYKLKFGHRGANQPVQVKGEGNVEITSQNHGFCVDMDSIKDPDVEVTHINLNDNTMEGIRHKKHPLYSVQYHPEASPGPHDAMHFFNDFLDMMDDWRKNKN